LIVSRDLKEDTELEIVWEVTVLNIIVQEDYHIKSAGKSNSYSGVVVRTV